MSENRRYFRRFGGGVFRGLPRLTDVRKGLLAAAAIVAALATPAHAADQHHLGAYPMRDCVVADPTGTPLNVRAAPDGMIVNDTSLRNGKDVTVYQVIGPWAYVGFAGGNPLVDHSITWGWVYHPHLSCEKGPPSIMLRLQPSDQ
jgi:hypothetical protein